MSLEKQDQSVDFEESKFIFPQEEISPETYIDGGLIIRSYMSPSDHMREIQELVTKYFQKQGCELLAPTQFKDPNIKMNEYEFELWKLPKSWDEPVKVFNQKIFFKASTEVRYVLSFPINQSSYEYSTKSQKFSSTGHIYKKIVCVWEALKRKYPIHIIMFLENPKTPSAKQNVKAYANQFISKVEVDQSSPSKICQGLTLLTADRASLHHYINEKEKQEICKLQRSHEERKKEILRYHESLKKEAEENEVKINILLEAL